MYKKDLRIYRISIASSAVTNEFTKKNHKDDIFIRLTIISTIIIVILFSKQQQKC